MGAAEEDRITGEVEGDERWRLRHIDPEDIAEDIDLPVRGLALARGGRGEAGEHREHLQQRRGQGYPEPSRHPGQVWSCMWTRTSFANARRSSGVSRSRRRAVIHASIRSWP